jgi:phenylacetate-CoA ligase
MLLLPMPGSDGVPDSVAVRDLDRQIAAAEFLPAAVLRRRQLGQAGQLARHFAEHSPRFAERLAQTGLEPRELATEAGFARLPPVDRAWMRHEDGRDARHIPDFALPLYQTVTSGSTGEPVRVRRTRINGLVWAANTLREHRWRGTRFDTTRVAVQATLPKITRHADWGRPATYLAETGPALDLPVTLAVEELYQRIRAERPGNLVIYPTTLDALLDQVEARGSCLAPHAELRTVGESVSARLRQRVRDVLGVELHDTYSSQELGHIAIQCPSGGVLHAAAEGLIVEVLRGDGTNCAPGETGEVVVTDLINCATPLVRYRTGDHAEVADPCACGRGALALRRVLGRTRNMIALPDGTRHWPLVGIDYFAALAPVRQFQFIQHDAQAIEVRLAVHRALSAAEEAALTTHIHATFGHAFTLDLRYFTERLPIGPNGKFEEFVRRF